MIITPTVGRIVWFVPVGAVVDLSFQPFAAIVTYVHSDRMVNLAIFDRNGVLIPQTSVQLVQEGDDKPAGGFYCEWMPYQIGQAKKHEAKT